MPDNKGKLIVIEGLDGSGKATQAAILLEQLQGMGKGAMKITFPDYESQSSALVKMYLSGEIGGIDDVNLYAASSFYAADRYISYEKNWKKQYNMGTILIADRYSTSNIIYQMAKLPRGEWESYIDWLWDFEFVKMRLPKPDSVVYLDMPPTLSRVLIEKRYGGNMDKMDIHERNLDYLEHCRCSALFAAEKLDWHVINCGIERDGILEPHPFAEISEQITSIVFPLL